MRNLGRVLAEWRHGQRLTLDEAAGVIGIGRATLQRLEKGHDPDFRAGACVIQWLLAPEPKSADAPKA